MSGADFDGGRHAERGLGRQARRLRLNTLVGVRWLAVLGQAGAILLVDFALRFPIPLFPSLACVLCSAILDLALRWRFPNSLLLSQKAAAALLAYDVLQLTALLWLTGGIANPFAFLLVAPVTIAAAALEWRRALALLALTLVCATGVTLWHMPLPWAGGETLALPQPYPFGLWTALIVSIAFAAAYAYRVASEARQLADALSATELVLARAQHLGRLDGLAAAAAHELGTPLGTIALVAREMASPPSRDEDFKEDLQLIEQSVERCRAILGRLAHPGDLREGRMEIRAPGELIELAAAAHRSFGPAIVVEADGPEPPPACGRNAGVLFGLGNLMENAVSFAESTVTARASWTPTSVSFVISDEGPGFPPHVLSRIGEPYLSSPNTLRKGLRGGLGLGLFIAKALLERSGAAIGFRNAKPPGRGAVVTVTWPRQAYEESGRPERSGARAE